MFFTGSFVIPKRQHLNKIKTKSLTFGGKGESTSQINNKNNSKEEHIFASLAFVFSMKLLILFLCSCVSCVFCVLLFSTAKPLTFAGMKESNKVVEGKQEEKGQLSDAVKKKKKNGARGKIY